MGVALTTVGRHNLKMDSPEIISRQLCDIFDINLAWGHWEGEDDNLVFVPHGQVIKHPEDVVGCFNNWADEGEKPYYVIFLPDPISSLHIGPEMAELDVSGWPHSAWHYESCFDQPASELEDYIAEDMLAFRKTCKDVFGKLGGSRVFHFPERGYVGFLEDLADEISADEFEDYILSGRYLDEALKGGNEWKRELSGVFYVPDFLFGKDKRCRKDGADVYYDDFADLS